MAKQLTDEQAEYAKAVLRSIASARHTLWDIQPPNMRLASVTATLDEAADLIRSLTAAPQPSARTLTDGTLLNVYAVLRELADANQARKDPVEAMVKARADVRALLAAEQPSEDQRDAERYRWLRGHHAEMMQWDQTGVWYPFDGKVPERLDAAIDAAIAKPEANHHG